MIVGLRGNARAMFVPTKTREVFTEGLDRTLGLIANALPDCLRPDARERALGVLSSMIGALQLSRALADPKLSQAALDAGVNAALVLGRGTVGHSH